MKIINNLIGGSEEVGHSRNIKKAAQIIIPLILIIGIIGGVYYISNNDIVSDTCIVRSGDIEKIKDKQLKIIEKNIKESKENYDKVKELTDKTIEASEVCKSSEDKIKAFTKSAKDSSVSANIALLKLTGASPSSPDASSPDASSPDASSPDASSPDASSPDASSPDASSPDASSPDVSSPDASSPDVSSPDVSSPDASSPDASPPPDTEPYMNYPFNDVVEGLEIQNKNDLGIKESHDECRDSSSECVLYYYVDDPRSADHKRCFCYNKEHILKAFTGQENLFNKSNNDILELLKLTQNPSSDASSSDDPSSDYSPNPSSPVDCDGNWSECDDECIKTFTITRSPENYGKICPTASKGLEETIINTDIDTKIKQYCLPGEDSHSWHDYKCGNGIDGSKKKSGCKGYRIDEINKNNENDNIEIKTVQPAADTPGPSWIDKTGSTGARSLADFGAYKKDLGCYLKYDNFGSGSKAHGNENLKMNGELLGTEEELKELCGERCYASKDCNHFQTWGGENNSKLEKGQPYSCCLYNIPDEKIPLNKDNTPFVGGKGKGKMWKLRNIKDGKYGIFGESSSSGNIKRVYKLNEIENIKREDPNETKYRMKEKTTKCNNGSISADSSKLSGSEVLDDAGNAIIETYSNMSEKLKKENYNTRLIIFILLILGYILYSC